MFGRTALVAGVAAIGLAVAVAAVLLARGWRHR